MYAPFSFIVTPKGKKRYRPANEGGFATSSSIEFAKDVNRNAIVVAVPKGYDGKIQPGDEAFIHHNVFRIYYNQQGKATNSRCFLYDDLYTVSPEELFLYKQDGVWYPHGDWCYVRPIKEDKISEFKQSRLEHTGIIVMSNEHKEGTIIGFTPESEYEVDFNGETLYRMRNIDICVYFNESGRSFI